MPLKDRFRRALNRPSERTSSHSSISSTSNPTTATTTRTPSTTLSPSPTTPLPAITLTKTSSRLSRILTGGGGNRADRKKEKEERRREERMEDWKRRDEEEWNEPKSKYPLRKSGKSAKHQEMLRAFEWRWRNSIDGRRSTYSGVSPGASRNASVDDGALPTMSRMLSAGSSRRRSSHSQMERVGSRADSHPHAAVDTVLEE